MKKMNYRLAALAVAWMMVVAASAKTQDYSGKVIDQKGEPVAFVNVVLLSLPDSAFVQGAVSDEQGAFRPGWGWVWGLPPLASQPGCRAVAKRLPNAHPVPGLPALLRHRGNCPGRGACLGSSVESSTRCSGLRRFPFFSSSTGPIATGSRRRRLVLKPSQKDALQALFQQNPYPGIATRERLARELGIDESRVQVGPPPLHPFSLSRLSMPIQGS